MFFLIELFAIYLSPTNLNNLYIMKTKVIFLCVVVCAAFSIYSYVANNKEGALGDLALMNVEALANGEIGMAICVGDGSVDCPHSNVKVLYYK